LTRRTFVAYLAAGLVALLAVTAVVHWSSTPSAHTRPNPRDFLALRRACGRIARPPKRYRHVIWIVFENKSFSDIIGSADAPYLNAAVARCGVAATFTAETHPSAPNYVAMTSGGTGGVVGDPDPIGARINAPSIFSQLGPGGWRALMESMPGTCRLQSVLPEYYARHNAPAFYSNVARACERYDVPLEKTPDLSARFTFVAPNSCHSMHTCAVATGDAWFGGFLPEVLDSPQYRAGQTVVFITWDESDGSANHIPTLVIAPSVRPGTVARESFNHYSLLRTTEELLGLHRFAGRATAAVSMRRAFGI
jgi:phosphatidylinositol-3-phosphatase